MSSTLFFRIGGMHCASCVDTVQDSIRGVPGVQDVFVNLASERAKVRWADSQHLGLDASLMALEISRALTRAGYQLLPEEEGTEGTHGARVAWTFAAGTAVMLLSMGKPSGAALDASALLASLIQFWAGGPFLAGAWRAARRGRANMDTLVSLGTLSAYAYSACSLFGLLPGAPSGSPGETYFEVSSLLIAFILLGKWLESRAKLKTGSALSKLRELFPETALTLRGDSWAEIPLAEILPGDRITIRPGDRIPVDGVLLEGASDLDESLITGESLPVAKSPGSPLIGGSLNGSGNFRMKASKIGKDTLLSRVADAVREAQLSRAPTQRLADRVSAVFVPVVLILAAATYLGWLWEGASAAHSLMSAVSVLIIACPCALGLATPAAIVVGTGKAAERGILFRDARSLEKLRETRIFVFDKTGTLTEGRFSVNQSKILRPSSSPQAELRLLQLCASAETGSEHPLARAITAYARSRGIEPVLPTHFKSSPGLGVKCQIGGSKIAVGSLAFLPSENLPADVESLARSWAEAGSTPVLMSVDGKPELLLGIVDTLKPGVKPLVSDLRARGLRVVLLTGDRKEVAARIARSAGIDEVFSEQSPTEKAQVVRKLRESGNVAMVGDGVNDAPSLAAADIGIALRSGSDIAVDASDVTLLRSEISSVRDAYLLSRQTFRTIRRNLTASFLYNALGIPLASGIFSHWTGWSLNPVVAGAAMGLSSVSVLLSSLLLKYWTWGE